MPFPSQLKSQEPITPAMLGYFHGYVQDQAFDAVWKVFEELSEGDGITRAAMARRLGKPPEQITRWLGAPGNWTLRTLSDLLLSMGHVPVIGATPIDDLPRGNYTHPASYGGSLNFSTATASTSLSVVVPVNRP